MFNANFKTAADLKEAARRTRAAQLEEARKARIFNVRNRVIGLDVAALDRQIKEKKAIKEAQEAEEEAYNKQQRFEVKRLTEIQYNTEKEKKRYLSEMLEFRQNSQRADSRREFDLNDPNMKKKDIPSRLGDDDPRLTVSSMQKFEGEAHLAAQRKEQQKTQLKAWLAQQIQEKKEEETHRKEAEVALNQSAAATDARVKELDRMSKRCREEMDRAVREFNFMMAEEKRSAKALRQKRDEEDTMMHINNMMNSDLTGSSLGQPSQIAPGKVVKTSYRGMSESEKAKIKEEQLKQIEERKEQDKIEPQADSDWLNLEQVQGEKFRQNKKCQDDEKRQRDEDTREENRLLAIKQKAQRRYLDEFVFKSVGPDSSFYEQFNKSTR